MDAQQEKELLLIGISKLKQQLLFTRGARSIDILERLENLRLCLELLVSEELKAKETL